MGLKRLLLLVAFAVSASLALVPGSGAGNFDEARMGCAGEDPAVCPTGTTGQPYSLRVYLVGDEDLGCAVFSVSSGSLPSGLSLSSEGTISGTPTQAGTFDFFLTVTYNKEVTCNKPASDDRFRIAINQGAPPKPKLVIGPETTSPGTVGTPYTLAMTANLPDAKTWSISAGTLPPGLNINPSDGVISGTPTASGTFTFTVRAVIDAQSSDTKTLGIVIRDRLQIIADTSQTIGFGNQLSPSEVGRPYVHMLSATGGTLVYRWTLTTGILARGIRFANGRFWGRPREEGSFPFTITVTDTENRVATFDGILDVAPRIRILKLEPMEPAIVGKRYVWQFFAEGGIQPTLWRIPRGTLPFGLRLDTRRGVLRGVVRGRPGRYKFRLQVRDQLGVPSTKTFLLKVKPAPKKTKKTASTP